MYFSRDFRLCPGEHVEIDRKFALLGLLSSKLLDLEGAVLNRLGLTSIRSTAPLLLHEPQYFGAENTVIT